MPISKAANLKKKLRPCVIKFELSMKIFFNGGYTGSDELQYFNRNLRILYLIYGFLM